MYFKRKKIFMITALIFLILAFILLWSFFLGRPPKAEKITWGVNFSQKHAQNLGLDWKETYSALISDLGAKNLKVAADWDLLEPKNDEYYFDDLDWQIKKAEENDAKIILIIGMKTSRWPECHLPSWVKNAGKAKQQEEILKMLEKVVLRYKESKAISVWQTENEPFFPFGDCQWSDKEFLQKEINLVRSLDPQKRPVLVSDSGEGSFWFSAAKMGDIVGTTMYRKVWFDFSWLKIKFPFLPDFVKKFGFYLDYNYFFPPKFYWQKANIVEKEDVVIRFSGDSGDGMQLTGTQFSNTSALFGNDVSTFPDYPAEIRAPQGTVGGVSGFQLHFGNSEVSTPGDYADVLVAMNPAALKANINWTKKGGTIISMPTGELNCIKFNWNSPKNRCIFWKRNT